MKKSLAGLTLSGALLLAGCSANNNSPHTTSQSAVSKNDEATYQDNVANTKRMRVEITDHKVINPGEKGNEEGVTPIMVFWYTATNKTDQGLTPIDIWGLLFTAYQGNATPLKGQDVEESIRIGHPLAPIEQNHSAQNMTAFKLYDKTAPLKLVIEDKLTNQKLGEQEFPIK
ncbi:DUF5067 domain-containing protein [Holzapfeliella sp. He02]|uniref:DUF5067 domain-containing protein n=1 Tax=Holzapfeliella saturejae TaxID=3082953 RepID=A0ABU8SHK4_9LACO